MTPEIDQTIEITASSDIPLGAFTYTLNPLSAQYYNVAATFNATGIAPGFYHLELTITDNGFPVGVTTKQFVFEVMYDASAQVDEVIANAFKLYPNPTQNELTIDLNEKIESAQVVVYDLYGKAVVAKNIQQNGQLDLSSFSAGIYLVNILVDNEVIGVQRIVKE
jgi:hypothetical protein